MKILITGTGYLATNLVKELIKNNDIEQIFLFSRSEKEQWEFKIKFNNPKLTFIIGDIRDELAINRAVKGIDYVIHTGAIKRIEVAEKQPMEAIKTNVLGTMNVINSCIDNKVKKLILISTDKATSATTCYGATKFLTECMANANETNTSIICIRYGNVFGSTGSVVPIFKQLKEKGQPLTVRNGNMTRFFIPVSKSIDMIIKALKSGKNKELWAYKSKSCTIQDLANVISTNQIVTGTESIEKNDEALLTVNELNHSKIIDDYYVVRKDYISENKYNKPLTSDNAERFTKEELEDMYEEWLNV